MSQVQIETSTVVGPITGAGNIAVVITSAYMTNSPKTFAVAAAGTETSDQAAALIRAALVYDADVAATFLVSGATDKVVLTMHEARANDTTLNISVTNGSCAGLTPALTSANTQAGIGISNGYATLAQYKAYQRITSTDVIDDAFIETAIEAASRHIDSQTRQIFYASTETRYFDTPASGGGEILFDAPLSSVTSVTNGDGNTVTTTDYYLLPTNGTPKYAIGLKDVSSQGWTLSTVNNSQSAIIIVGVWGYSAVPQDIYLACLELTKAFYSRRFGENMTMKTIITAAGVVQVPDGVPDWVAQVLISNMRLGFS
jgi:uncharacterized phiE125 gp8 family phage protein